MATERSWAEKIIKLSFIVLYRSYDILENFSPHGQIFMLEQVKNLSRIVGE